MWIVGFIGEEEHTTKMVYVRHSAWFTEKEAEHQRDVLKEHGYRRVQVYEDDTVQTENGHYYV